MTVTPNVIEGPYLQDLLEQPAAIDRTLRRLRSSSELKRVATDLKAGSFRRILLTGMGGSLSALHPLHLQLTRAGLISQMVETSELLRYQSNALGAESLVVVVSQSGRSAEIVSLLDHGANGATIVGVTNYEDSPLAKRSHVPILMAAGDECSVSCKTYVASLITLKWLGAELTGEGSGSRDELGLAAAAVEEYLAGWRSHVELAGDRLRVTQHLVLAGRGESLSAAQTGGLILKESAHFPAEGMSSAAFRHGPFEMISPSMLVAVFEGDANVSQLNRRLVEDVRQSGGDAELIGFDAPSEVFRLPAAPESVRAILEILPVQMISLALAARNGHEAGRFQRATKVTVVE